MAWIQTRSGRIFDYEDIPGSEIDFNDVAFSLGNMCRFNGHTLRFYSVLEHTVRMVKMPDHLGLDLPPEESRLLRGLILIHDAHEAYIGDWVRPLKAYFACRFGSGSFDDLEHRVKTHVRCELGLDRYDVPKHILDLCDRCDVAMLSAEGRQLMGRNLEDRDWCLPDGADADSVGFEIPLGELRSSEYWVGEWLRLYTKWMSEIGGI